MLIQLKLKTNACYSLIIPYGYRSRFIFICTADVFDFVEKDNFIHRGVVEDGNVITGIGMFFREFAEAVLRRFEYDIGDNFMRYAPDEYTEEELTFYWSDDEYQEFLEELKEYTA